MIKKIFRTENDLANLSHRRIQAATVSPNVDYRYKIVDKPWGYEYLLFENLAVAIWILFIKFGHSTSLHCHPQKLTSLILLGGQATISTLSDSFALNEKDALIIDAGVFHSTAATSHDGILLMEIETPPNKHDLVRLKDEYGRRDMGYEKNSISINDLSKNNYCDFHNVNIDAEIIDNRVVLGQRSFYLCKNNWETMISEVKNERTLMCLLDNKSTAVDGNVCLKTGEIIEITEFNELMPAKKAELQDKILLLLK